MAALCVVFGVVLAMGHAAVVRHRAAGAADLAALAAADHWSEGGAAACARAGRVAGAQQARLVRCAVDGDVSEVTVASGAGPFGAEARARAGPAETAVVPPEGTPQAPLPPADPAAGPAAGGTAPPAGAVPAGAGPAGGPGLR
ncbi:Rv3654c family TadE-like protein [Streptomyces sp. NPDC048566]|uniref:Rv3654c family TadE-like protein n=1 Tax=Streptomyces sp. NPDC048566 TaxID=3365569 RepID=UPI0037247C18